MAVAAETNVTALDETKEPDNFQRLLTHLQAGSLAAQLVHAHSDPGKGDRLKLMKAVFAKRLPDVREVLSGTED